MWFSNHQINMTLWLRGLNNAGCLLVMAEYVIVVNEWKLLKIGSFCDSKACSWQGLICWLISPSALVSIITQAIFLLKGELIHVGINLFWADRGFTPFSSNFMPSLEVILSLVYAYFVLSTPWLNERLSWIQCIKASSLHYETSLSMKRCIDN